ncbi:AraC-like ligand-binding domain-containing protein [Paraburkholderia bannensis]|uniref:AraC-like ligand-binding domain-containing protein n=1 Tax=Paraburkholderia bannensis TaxID=765414 RepID=UPI002AB1D40A|nr:helix-turn-helix domain-containing protein [Paraburkholderia bannensis]
MIRLDTEYVPSAKKRDYWLAALADSFVGLDFSTPGNDCGMPFAGCIDQGALGSIDVSVVTARPHRVMRTDRLIRKKEEELFLVSLQESGRGEVHQDGRRVLLEPGDLAIYDTTRAYALAFEGPFRQFVLSIPRDLLRVRVQNAQSLVATPLRAGAGFASLFLDLIHSVARNMDAMTPEIRESVSSNVLDLLATGLSTVPAPLPTGSALKTYHLNRIKTYIREHLANPELNIAQISEALGMSVSSLYRSFEENETSLSQWIWEQRLQACRSALLDETCKTTSIKQIAMGWGFSDPAHFSRAFRRRFGETALALRGRSTQKPD